MIKINLLPVREWRKKEAVRQQISIYFLSLVLLVTGLLASGITIQGKVSAQRDEIARLKAEKQKLAYVNKTIRQVREKRDEIETKFKAIEDLQKGRTLAVRVLDELVSSLPIDRVWLTRLNFASNQMQLSGVALDNHTVALFMRRLESSDLFKSVNLSSTRRKDIDGHDLMEFNLAVQIASPGNSEDGKTEKSASKKDKAK